MDEIEVDGADRRCEQSDTMAERSGADAIEEQRCQHANDDGLHQPSQEGRATEK